MSTRLVTMSKERRTHWIVRGIPAVVLVLTAVLLIVAGVVFPFGAAANSGPGSGQISPGFVALGACLVFGGAALFWLARAVWRS